VSFPGNLRVEAKVGEFIIATDQPEKSGGEGTAPARLPCSFFHRHLRRVFRGQVLPDQEN